MDFSLQPRVRFILALAIVQTAGVAFQAKAATYTDSQGLAELTVLPAASSAAGFVAWQFRITPLTATREVSSIDAASGDLGFSGEALRQVNPNGQPTVFSDSNAQFGAGDDATTDTQFVFHSSSLLVAPGSQLESGTQLEAVFTSFPPIRVASGPTLFAQVVAPDDLGGQFSGAFALRLLSGGAPDVAIFSSILFGSTAGDFNSDGFTDTADLAIWSNRFASSTDGNDFLNWQRNFTAPVSSAAATIGIPEPSSLGLIAIGASLTLCPPSRRQSQKHKHDAQASEPYAHTHSLARRACIYG